MTISVPPSAMISLLPETAPFSPEQRAWLNGFFAGLLAPVDASPSSSIATPAQAHVTSEQQAVGFDESDDAPWHDPAMLLEDRMRLAEEKPLRRRLMAAMAQQDCGQCGYVCETYADAIAGGTEARLNLCVPGEKPTLRALKGLIAEAAAVPAVASRSAEARLVTRPLAASEAIPQGYSRETPVNVTFLSRRRLNKEGSEKATYHIEFDLSDCGLDYVVGDSFGVYPQNDPALVDAILMTLKAPQDFPVMDRSLREFLLSDVSLGTAPDALFELISYVTGGDRKQKARRLARGEDPDGDAATLDVLAALEKFAGIHPDPEAFAECLEPLQPRLYSISSSHNKTPGRVTLTVDHVRYQSGTRHRHGVASSWLAERLEAGTKFRAYVQKAHDFALPAKGDTPIIMVGPGTGVAPFRAFLHERDVQGAKGGAWLFFGHQRRGSDFFYEEEMEAFQRSGVLSNLSLAWSREGATKTYVQDKLRESGQEVWDWIARGAHFYVCGDAQHMARDVERALVDIVGEHSGRDAEAAQQFVQNLRKTGAYQTDVY